MSKVEKKGGKKIIRKSNKTEEPVENRDAEEKKYYLTQDMIKELRKVYDSVDINKDQNLSVPELQKLFLIIKRELTDREIKHWLQSLGKNSCNFEDFINFERHLLHRDKIEDEGKEAVLAFRTYDNDGRGIISCEELKKILTESGDKFSQEEVDKVFKIAELRDDGVFCYEKFVKQLRNLD